MHDSTLVVAASDDRYASERETGHAGTAVAWYLLAEGRERCDLRRVVANARDYRADAWMSKVIP